MEPITVKSKILAAISYIPFPPLFLITLFAAKNDKFAEFHGKQGLVIFLAWFGLWIVGLIRYATVVAYAGFLALVIVGIIAIVKVCLGLLWQAPLLGKFAKKIQF